MAVSIEDFMKDASDEQKELLFDLVELGEEERKAREKYDEKIGSYDNSLKRTNFFGDERQERIAKEDFDDLAAITTTNERKEIKRIRGEMKILYKKSIELGMGNLGLIQRYYMEYVGEPIPKSN